MSFKQSERENREDNMPVWKTWINPKTQGVHILEDSHKTLDRIRFQPFSWLYHPLTLMPNYKEIHVRDKSTCCTKEILPFPAR